MSEEIGAARLESEAIGGAGRRRLRGLPGCGGNCACRFKSLSLCEERGGGGCDVPGPFRVSENNQLPSSEVSGVQDCAKPGAARREPGGSDGTLETSSPRAQRPTAEKPSCVLAPVLGSQMTRVVWVSLLVFSCLSGDGGERLVHFPG